MTSPPMSLEDLLALLTTSGLAVGVVAAGLCGLLWRFLAGYWPGHGYAPPENWKRLITLVVPFTLALAAYGVMILLGQAPASADLLWSVLYVGFVGAGGKQLAFTAYKGIRPPAPQP